MLTCLALVAFNAASLGEIPRLASDIEAEARSLASVSTVSPNLIRRLEDFSSDAEQISVLLGDAGVGQDMPCIFQGIANDARQRARDLAVADDVLEQEAVFMNLRLLMEDTAMLAPLAAAAAADRTDDPRDREDP